MEPQCIVELPAEYDRKILDDSGNMVEAVADSEHLCIRTIAGHYDNNLDAMRKVDIICMPVQDTLRFIMMTACVTQSAGMLGEATNEILRSIEAIARHEISQQNLA